MPREDASSILTIKQSSDTRTKVLESDGTVGRKCCRAASEMGLKKERIATRGE